MGQRASNTAGVTFEDVVVPKEVCPLIAATPRVLIMYYCINRM